MRMNSKFESRIHDFFPLLLSILYELKYKADNFLRLNVFFFDFRKNLRNENQLIELY